jgi:hypothetical protein
MIGVDQRKNYRAVELPTAPARFLRCRDVSGMTQIIGVKRAREAGLP